MKRLLLLLLSVFVVNDSASGQVAYKLEVRNEEYVPLNSGKVVSGRTGWLEPNYCIPLGFIFPLGDTSLTHFNLFSNVVGTGTERSMITTGFMLTGAQFCDRGLAEQKSVSPLRYEVSGKAGQRVFKFEYANAGFVEEYFKYHTNHDYLNFQVWLFEGSGAVEYHFGSSAITHFGDYFPTEAGVKLGYVRELGIYSLEVESVFLLSGQPKDPTVEHGERFESCKGLAKLPVAGTVYRLAPAGGQLTKLHSIAHEKRMKVFPANFREYVEVMNPLREETRFELLSASGACVQRGELQFGGNRIDTSGLAEGMYILVVNGMSGTELHRIIKS